jgi:hypothetical protein
MLEIQIPVITEVLLYGTASKTFQMRNTRSQIDIKQFY